MKNDEIWQEIPHWDGYFASTYGRIGSEKSGQFRILNQRLHQKGYSRIDLWGCNENSTMLAHQLIMLTFCGYPFGLVVNHKDGNKINNCLNNLEYIKEALRDGQ